MFANSILHVCVFLVSFGDTRRLNLLMKNVSDCRLNWNHNLDIDVRTVEI